MTTPQSQQSCTFSVIMPCYNSEAYLRGAVTSLLEQTYPNWELIAVNDGSQDHTLDILREYAEQDRRILVYSKENGGYVSAVNYGLGKITGSYFLLMGSDDSLAPNLFSELHLCAEEESPDCMAWRSVFVQDGVILDTPCGTDFSDAVYMGGTTFASYARAYPVHSNILFTRDTSKCFKRSLLGDLRYFGQYGYDADGIFSMMLCHNAHSFAAIPVDGYFWTLRKDSLSGRKTFFAQEFDRTHNWVSFFQYLLTLDPSEITPAEGNFLYYFLSIIRNTWQDKVCTWAQYPLSLPAEDRLLLYAPAVWKLYTSLPFDIRSLLSQRKPVK